MDKDKLLRIRQQQIKLRMAMQAAPQTDLPQQSSSGLNEGITALLGAPVDLLQGRWNQNARALQERGVDAQEMQGAFGSSEHLRETMGPLISDVEPQTALQGFARRAGQEVGAGAVAGPAVGLRTAGGLVLNTAADALAGIGGEAAERLGGNETVQLIASILSGSAPVAATSAARSRANVPSVEDLRRQAGDRYEQVAQSPVRLSPDQAQELQGNVSARMYQDRMNPSLHPQAAAAVDEVYMLPRSPSLQDVVETRRAVNRGTRLSPMADNAKEVGRLGKGIREEIDDYLANIGKQQNAYGDVEALREADALHRRASAAQTLESAVTKAQRRAATSGAGGNEINTTRQNIRAILDNPNKAAGFTEVERALMESIVRGDRKTNAARRLGGLAPSRGALPLMANIAAGSGAGVGVATGQPWAAMALAPGVIGEIAKRTGEHLTDRQVKNLAETIRYGKPLPGKTLSEAERRVFTALMMAAGGNTLAE